MKVTNSKKGCVMLCLTLCSVCSVEHPRPESKGEDSCSHYINSEQKEGKETLEEKP